MIRVKLPDGKYARFPDGTSQEEILSSIEGLTKPAASFQDVFKQALNQSKPNMGADDAVLQAARPAAASVARFGENVLDIPKGIEELLFTGPSRVFGKSNLGSTEIDIPESQKDTFDKVSGMVPELGLSLFSAPTRMLGSAGELFSAMPMLGKYLKSALQYKPLQEGITQGGIAATFAPEEQGKAGITATSIATPMTALAGRVGRMTPETSFLMKTLRSFFPSKRAEQNLLEEVNQTNYQPILEAAKRQGLPFVTPGEAAKDEILLAREGKLGKGSVPLTREKTYAFGAREKKEESIINSLMENIIPEKEYPKITELYSKSNPVEIPEKVLDKFKHEKYYNDAKKYAEKEFNLDGIPENTIEFQDKIRDSLWDLAEDAKSGKRRELNQFRRELVKEIDLLSPEYKEARNLSERKKAREGIQDFFDARDKTGENFAEYLKSKKKYDKLEFHLRNNPESIQQLRDMKLIFEKAEELNKKNAAKQAISGEKGPKEALVNKFMDMLTGKHAYDEAGIKLITDPKWSERLHALATVSDREKFFSGAMDLFGKALAQESLKLKRGEFGKSLFTDQ